MYNDSPGANETRSPDAPASDGSTLDLSVIIPLYNEEANVEPLYDALHAVLPDLGRSYEVIFVNDGSRDRTGTILADIAARDANIKVIDLRRNFGQTAAILAGIDHSSGAVVVPMDGDLQNDPKDIGRLLDKL